MIVQVYSHVIGTFMRCICFDIETASLKNRQWITAVMYIDAFGSLSIAWNRTYFK
jgi:hypothetical protein